MNILFSEKKGIGTKDSGISSAWFLFDYKNVDKINGLLELFSITIGEIKYDASFNQVMIRPILIEDNSGVYKYQKGEIDTTLINVVKCMIKLDIFIKDEISGILRNSEIELNC